MEQFLQQNSPHRKLISLKHLLQFLAMLVIEDYAFYWSHRLLHHPLLYKRMHKIHHEFDFTIAYMTLYCHWFEFIISDMLPIGLSLHLFQSNIHVFTVSLFASYSLFKTHYMHCGYEFMFFPVPPDMPRWLSVVSAEHHDFHHTRNLGNFSTGIALWERYMGSDEIFKKEKKGVAD